MSLSFLMKFSSIAGSDSTSIAMRAVLYNLMNHPGILAKVLAEIDSADQAHRLSSPIKQAEAMSLVYTCACIKEAMRVFPPWQIHMPRHTPPEGLELSGNYIAGGYRVGVNPALVHFNKEVFGLDADEYRPERWLESQERSFAMDKAILGFGAGSRTCIGKNVSLNRCVLVPNTKSS
jgi:cytochrome P450